MNGLGEVQGYIKSFICEKQIAQRKIAEIEEKCNILITDTQKRKEFAEKAYFTIKDNFVVETITDKLEDLYKRAIEQNRH